MPGRPAGVRPFPRPPRPGPAAAVRKGGDGTAAAGMP